MTFLTKKKCLKSQLNHSNYAIQRAGKLENVKDLMHICDVFKVPKSLVWRTTGWL